jgi:hypothetical protein
VAFFFFNELRNTGSCRLAATLWLYGVFYYFCVAVQGVIFACGCAASFFYFLCHFAGAAEYCQLQARGAVVRAAVRRCGDLCGRVRAAGVADWRERRELEFAMQRCCRRGRVPAAGRAEESHPLVT